jgi:hypothetical protein
MSVSLIVLQNMALLAFAITIALLEADIRERRRMTQGQGLPFSPPPDTLGFMSGVLQNPGVVTAPTTTVF